MAERIRIDPVTDALLLVDVQPDFMPGGALAVPDGDAVLPVINRLLAGPFRHAVATQDWHPPGHASFASAHPGRAPFETVGAPYGPQTLWPDHCVQGSPGAALHNGLDQARIELILRKGWHPSVDSYSAFRENDRTTSTCLDAWLRARGFRRLFLTGLATDFCVAWSAEDAVALGFSVVVIEDACRGIGLPAASGHSSIDIARERLQRTFGVPFVTSDLLAT
ncbi:Nicotinamidase [Rhodovastum atsumiense]|uniref:Nicotinamidase n=2 Tax=Rhodovastum atsumiense TaxID=504468 RepID=A0A5M6ITG2_9PROT|nr:bifunctional nicotinamidase/pyrazinamidase [Rhodovastum atsumiense]KAA5610735.1 bifunctional nicotinamidase/pyrazinamidase [Rhodovastum atsumiense]CAH2604361.1 Nicotinamidase [Rhodovastum atsumiense]